MKTEIENKVKMTRLDLKTSQKRVGELNEGQKTAGPSGKTRGAGIVTFVIPGGIELGKVWHEGKSRKDDRKGKLKR